MTLQTDGRPDGRGYYNIPAFSSKSAGIKRKRQTDAFKRQLCGGNVTVMVSVANTTRMTKTLLLLYQGHSSDCRKRKQNNYYRARSIQTLGV